MDRNPDTAGPTGRDGSATGCGPYRADQPAQPGNPQQRGELPQKRTERTKLDEVVSISDAAAECGVTVETFIAWMVESGMFLEHPTGGYIPSPHPDLVELDR